jgi:isochorismate hydrolase
MKKERYFSQSNAVNKIKFWEQICGNMKSRKPYKFVLENASLLILDMQNYFLDSNSHAFVPSAPEIISNIQLLISLFSGSNRPIFFTRHITGLDEKDLMKTWWRDPIALSEERSKIIPELKASSDSVIIKHQYSAFYETDLSNKLRESNTKQIVITGVMTHLCCETTARDGFMNGFKIFFPFDATASYNEELHLGSLKAISHGFGACLPTKSLLDGD